MMNHQSSRRGFMNLTGAGIAALVGGAWPGTAAADEGHDADLVVLNAKVYTVDSRAPRVEAFAVKGRGAAGQYDQRRLQLTRGSDQRIHYTGQIDGLRRPVGRSVHGGQRENQGPSDRPHGDGRDYGLQGVTVEATGFSRCSEET